MYINNQQRSNLSIASTKKQTLPVIIIEPPLRRFIFHFIFILTTFGAYLYKNFASYTLKVFRRTSEPKIKYSIGDV